MSPAIPPPSLVPRDLRRLTLVLGGARSGKTAYAQNRLLAAAASVTPGTAPVYVATGQPGDGEMAERITRHQQDRGLLWETVEAPLALPDAVRRLADRAVLVDCLTLWISNLMMAGLTVGPAVDALIDAAQTVGGPLIFVGNEVGLGIVPDNALARAFRDHAGWTNQALAKVCQTVVFVAAGLPLILKDQS